MTANITRREAMWRLSSLAALVAAGCETEPPLGDVLDDILADPACLDVFPDGTFVEVVPFVDEPANVFGIKESVGWDARLTVDLSALDEGAEVLAASEFFVRTELPDELTTSHDAWRVRVHGLVDAELSVSLADLTAAQVDLGEVLIECAGNTRNRAFGLMSATSWAGVPLSDLLDASTLDSDAAYVIVRGFDGHSTPSDNGHSTPGAEWVFPLAEAIERGALAVQMGGEALPPDHGAPVRWLMPGWYGCSQIKWVESIEVVGADALATSQMIEFAERTHQQGAPVLAADHARAVMQRAAMPVRIEKWEVDGEIRYRMLGIVWGGDGPVGELLLDDGETEEAVTLCDRGAGERTWTLWVHEWRPPRRGSYLLAMRVVDEQVPTFRLDRGWYERTVEVDEKVR
jgi:DMSO/TMAO reductase YedYZ molybdopterin-dependent catalytic subunit